MKKRHQSGKKNTIIILAVILCLIIGWTAAKYLRNFPETSGVMTSESFYFTAELLGDSEMTQFEGEHFFLNNPENGTWHLYGGGEHKVTINVRNYYDDLRVTQEVITYSAGVKGENDIGATLTDGNGNQLGDTLTLGTQPETESGTYEKDEQQLCLTIPDNYKETSTVTVTIQSSRPYTKIMELSFVVYPAEQALTYEIVDSVNSPYAELIIRNGTSQPVSPVIDWRDTTLSIDNTNELTFVKKEDGTFDAQPGMTEKNMTLSRAIKSGESVSIYLFKSDKKNYAMKITPVDAQTNTITIRNHD